MIFYQPGSGTCYVIKKSPGEGGVSFSPALPTSNAQGKFEGIGDCDLKDPKDRGFAFDYTGNGHLDHLVFYRPGQGTIWIFKAPSAGSNVFETVFHSTNGVGGFDLRGQNDRVFAFDWSQSGKRDHIVLYRAGAKKVTIVRRDGDRFADVFASDDGIGGYDLSDPSCQAFAFDWNGNGKMDHIVTYLPANGDLWIQGNNGGTFSSVYKMGAGSGGQTVDVWENPDPADVCMAFDWTGSGRQDHLLFYRRGQGICWVFVRVANQMASIWKQRTFGRYPQGVGGYGLGSMDDKVFAFDCDGVGNTDDLVMFRSGTGKVSVLYHTLR